MTGTTAPVQAHTFEGFIVLEVLVAVSFSQDGHPIRFAWQREFTSKKLLHLLARYASARIAPDNGITEVEPRFRIAGTQQTMTRQGLILLAQS